MFESGQGKWQWTDGSTYDGGQKRGRKEGYGVHDLKDGERYDCGWSNNTQHGFGIHVFANTSGSYTGGLNYGKKAGFGKDEWNGGGCYEGGWTDNEQHGYGRQKHPDGSIYDGGWKHANIHGYGKRLGVKGGEIYDGGYKEERFHGYGTFTFETATSTTAGGRLEFNSVTVSSHSNPEKGTTVVGLKTNDTATEYEVDQIHGVKHMMEGGTGIMKMITESTKTTRKTTMEVGSRENHKVKG